MVTVLEGLLVGVGWMTVPFPPNIVNSATLNLMLLEETVYTDVPIKHLFSSCHLLRLWHLMAKLAD